MKMKLLPVFVAVAVSAACVAVSVSTDRTADATVSEPVGNDIVTMEEYRQMTERAAAEVESELGISYADYCACIEELRGSVIYIHYKDGAVVADVIKTIDAGRTGFEWSGNGFDIYLDTLVMSGGFELISTCVLMTMNPVAGLIVGALASSALQYYSENNCPNGVVLHYNCYWTVNTPFGSFDVYHPPYLENTGAQ